MMKNKPKDSPKEQNVDKKTLQRFQQKAHPMLNTNMRELIDLQKKNNRLVEQIPGNLMIR